MNLNLYVLNLICLVQGYWWSVTEPTTEPPILNAVTSEEFYFQDKILQYQFVLPGTKYCGPGNRSSGPDDLGTFKNVDTCCRDHDLCPENIPAGKYKHGLYNNARFTKLHCDCDKVFHQCLKDVGTPPARAVGALFFTIFHINCFKKEYPVIDCSRRRNRRCLEYKLNFTAFPVYQWFDNPFFRHWIDQFPQEIINVTILENMTATELMNSDTDLFLNSTESNFIIDNSSYVTNSMNVETSTMAITTSAPYFGGYFQAFYESVSNYLYSWTSSITGYKKQAGETNTSSEAINVL